MEKIDRTGAVVTNKFGQTCRIISYTNNKCMSVEIIDSRNNKRIVRDKQRFHKFVRGLIVFNASREGETWKQSQQQTPPPHVAQAYAEIDADSVQGRAIGCSMFAALFAALCILIAVLFIVIR